MTVTSNSSAFYKHVITDHGIHIDDYKEKFGNTGWLRECETNGFNLIPLLFLKFSLSISFISSPYIFIFNILFIIFYLHFFFS